jgi:hypothetical protein
LIARGSESALHIWRGLLAYVVYSYVLYAFFIHFNRLFLVYTGALAFSFYALVASLATQSVPLPASLPRARLAITALTVSALLFALLWLSEIVPANLAEVTPASLEEVGLIVNPVHVLDLAFVLPAMAIAAALLRNRRPAGYLLAVPLLVFAVMMGIAIEFMFIAMGELGPGAAIMGVIVVLSALAAFRLLRDLQHQNV